MTSKRKSKRKRRKTVGMAEATVTQDRANNSWYSKVWVLRPLQRVLIALAPAEIPLGGTVPQTPLSNLTNAKAGPKLPTYARSRPNLPGGAAK